MSKVKWGEVLQIFAFGMAWILAFFLMIVIVNKGDLDEAGKLYAEAEKIRIEISDIPPIEKFLFPDRTKKLEEKRYEIIKKADETASNCWLKTPFCLLPLPVILVFCVGKIRDDISPK